MTQQVTKSCGLGVEASPGLEVPSPGLEPAVEQADQGGERPRSTTAGRLSRDLSAQERDPDCGAEGRGLAHGNLPPPGTARPPRAVYNLV